MGFGVLANGGVYSNYDRNTVFGYQAWSQGISSGTGTSNQENTLFGYRAGNAFTTAFRNTIVGANSGNSITTTSNITIVGRSSGTGTVGSNSTIIGGNSGLASTGGGVTIVGATAATNLSGSANCTFIGFQCGSNVGTISGDATCLGANSGGVGAGGTIPKSVFIGSGSVSNSTAIVDRPTAVGYGTIVSGSNGTCLGADSSTAHVYGCAIGSGAVTTATNQIIMGRSAGQEFVQIPYLTTMGTAAATTVFCDANGKLSNPASDIRLKHSIVYLEDDLCLENIDTLKPCKFKYVESRDPNQIQQYGFIAQDIETSAFPQFVTSSSNGPVDEEGNSTGENYKGFSKENLMTEMVGAMKSLKRKYEQLEDQNERLITKLNQKIPLLNFN